MKKYVSIIASIAMVAAMAAGSVNAFAEEGATEAPTEAVTEAPTEAATEAPTEEATEGATEGTTEAPTEAATEAAHPIDEETAIGNVLLKAGKNFKAVSAKWEDGQTASYWRVGIVDATKENAETVYYHVDAEGNVTEEPVPVAVTTTAKATTTKATTTKAAATKAASKDAAPKTGDAFPAIPVAGAAVTAVAVAFALRKKND